MAQKRTSRFSLADLVMAVVMCGLLVAFFQSLRGRFPMPFPFLLVPIWAVLVFWSIIRGKRKGPTCEACGKKFIQPRQKPAAMTCPACGRQMQPHSSRFVRILATISWIMVGLGGFLLVTIAILLREFDSPSRLIRPPALLALMVSVFSVLVGFLAVRAYRRYLMTRPRELTCTACGTVVPPGQVHAPAICPACRIRRLSPDQAQKEQTKGFWILLGCLAFFLFLIVGYSYRLASGLYAENSWITVLPAMLVPVCAGYFVYRMVRLMLRAERLRRLLSEPATFAMARKCTGEAGEIVQDGPLTIWFSGPTNPAPMLREQEGVSRIRFEAVIGEPLVEQAPLRIVCFPDRAAFEKFHAGLLSGIDYASQDGIFFPSPWRMLTLCTAESPGRITDPRVVTRSLFAYVLMEQVFGALPIPWLQAGLARPVTVTDPASNFVRVNRKMVVAMALGTEWSEELFRLTGGALGKLVRRKRNPGAYQKSEQFGEQSASIVEYLSGDRAPDERKAAFRRFLKEKPTKDRQEEAFFRHFGFGFGSLLDSWREWVLARGIGTYEPPPPRVRNALLHRILPIIRDRQADHGLRIRAIRELGRSGFVLGGDTLIELLREGGGIPKVGGPLGALASIGHGVGRRTGSVASLVGRPASVAEGYPIRYLGVGVRRLVVRGIRRSDARR